MTEGASASLVYLDAMTFIFAVEGKLEIAAPLRALFDMLRRRSGTGVTSELTLAEVFAGADKPPNPVTRRAYMDLIVWSKSINLVPISREVLYESADLRFVHREGYRKKLHLPDAIHLTTAIQARCKYFMSADKGIRPPVGMTKILPDSGGVAEIQKALEWQ